MINSITKNDLFPLDEIKKVLTSLQRNINPFGKEDLPDSDSDAEFDLKPRVIKTLPLLKPMMTINVAN